MAFLKKLFKKTAAASTRKTRIDDHFSAQMSLIVMIGVWREDFILKTFPYQLTRILNVLAKRLIYLITLHIAILFSITLYFDIQKGVFADITYSLSQTVIFHFNAFVILYFQLRENTIFNIVDFVNENFRFRSAKGITKKKNVTNLLSEI